MYDNCSQNSWKVINQSLWAGISELQNTPGHSSEVLKHYNDGKLELECSLSIVPGKCELRHVVVCVGHYQQSTFWSGSHIPGSLNHWKHL